MALPVVATSPKDKFPAPSVFKPFPDEPSAVGRFKVKLDPTVAAALGQHTHHL